MTAKASSLGCGSVLGVVAAMAFLTACAAESDPVRPELATGVSVAQCLDFIESAAAARPSDCPAYLIGPLTDAMLLCRESGGRPAAIEAPAIWALDVNADGRQEFAFELEGVVSYEGAWSAFSCGSLGCPKILYEERGGAWGR